MRQEDTHCKILDIADVVRVYSVVRLVELVDDMILLAVWTGNRATLEVLLIW
jgi:hypothetical protein